MTEAMCIDPSLFFFFLPDWERVLLTPMAGRLFLSGQVIPQIFSLILLCLLACVNSIIFAAINQNVHVIFSLES